jgi:phosphoribosylformylglycinamidine synthase
VISGNVSFYNESFGSAIRPTPTVGMVGLLEDIENKTDAAFKDEGDAVLLLGETSDELGGSELLRWRFDVVAGRPPAIDLDREARLCALVREMIEARLVKSAHDCSEGGLATALAESAMLGDIGFSVALDSQFSVPNPPPLSPCALLFSESQGRVVVSAAAASVDSVLSLAEISGIHAKVIGRVGGTELAFDGLFAVGLEDAARIWEGSLERMVNGDFDWNG